MKPFIFGIEDRIVDGALLSTEELFQRVGHNSGNLAFHHAMARILGLSGNTSWYKPAPEIDAAGDLAVMPCANQLGSHMDLGRLAARFEPLQPKIVAIGLGAQGATDYKRMPEIPEGSVNWVRQIVAHAPSGRPNISVRGEFTRSVLERYGLADHAVVLGCPTLFINPAVSLGKDLEIASNKPSFDRVAIAGGHYGWRHLQRLEASLTRIMAATGGSYIVQSPQEFLHFARGEANTLSPDTLGLIRDFVAPEANVEDMQAWAYRYAMAFYDISSWMEHLKRYDLVIGLRIHGVMLALQAGVPAICIAHDSRTRELCETMKVPFVMASDHVSGISRATLTEIARIDGAAFDENRQQLGKRFGEFLAWQGLRPAPAYRGLLGDPLAAPPPAPAATPVVAASETPAT